MIGPGLVWLSGLSASLQTKGSPVQFPGKAQAWVAGQVPSRGRVRGKHALMFLSLFLPPFPCLNINKILKKKKRKKTGLVLVTNFLDMTPKALATKADINSRDYKLKSFCM